MTVVLHLNPELEARLLSGAARQGVPLSQYVQTLLQQTPELLNQPDDQDDGECSIMDLEGLGAEMWRSELNGRDAQEWVSEQREDRDWGR